LDNDYTQKLRDKLDRRIHRLTSTEHDRFHQALKIFWKFLQSEIVFENILTNIELRLGAAVMR